MTPRDQQQLARAIVRLAREIAQCRTTLRQQGPRTKEQLRRIDELQRKDEIDRMRRTARRGRR